MNTDGRKLACTAAASTAAAVTREARFVIPVFYNPAMSVWIDSSSPSPNKPKAVVASWSSRFAGAFSLRDVKPVGADDFALAHSRQFVEDILACRRTNGFGDKSRNAAASFPFTSGAMLGAAREAIANGKVAVAPCSGFHHAEWDGAMSYCTFNGLVIAARKLVEEGRAKRVGILDFDQHYGNGTDQIIRYLGLQNIVHYTAGREYGHDPSQAESFLARIPRLVESMAKCDVILYQAGADPHIDDPLGGWLNTEQLWRRDRTVFETAALNEVPVAWNLAGGYQAPLRKVLDIHDNTMAACIEIFAGADRVMDVVVGFADEVEMHGRESYGTSGR